MERNFTYWTSRFFYGLSAVAFIGVCTGATWHIVTCLAMAGTGALISYEWRQGMKEGE